MTSAPRDADRAPVIPALVLGLLTALSRVPFRSDYLFAWDSANFALALAQYNVGFHQPQPPGYPAYVGAARILFAALGNANAAYVWLSVVASGVAVACLVLAGARLYGRRTGLLAGLLLATSSVFWSQGLVAYPYAFLAAFSALGAWLCRLIRERRSAALIVGTAAIIGLSGGFRTELIPFLIPLWLYASLERDRLQVVALGLLAMGLSVLAWYVPMVLLSGGWAAYQSATHDYYAYFIQTTSGAGKLLLGLLENTRALVGFLYNGMGIALLPMLYFIGRYFAPQRLVADERARFVGLWLVPPLVFYVTVHVGNPGYVLSLLPALCVYATESILGLLEDLREALRTRVSWVLPAAIAGGIAIGLSNTALFFLASGEGRWREIRQIDLTFERQLREIGERYPPASTLIVAYDRSRQYRYYLPGHKIELLFDVAVAGAVTDTSRYWERRTSYRVPPGINAVLFPDLGRNTSDQPGLVQRQDLGDGVDLYVARVQPGDEIRYGYQYATGVRA
jgi:hypothetical protein